MLQLLNQVSFIRTLCDSIPIWILVLDPERRVHLINKSACNLGGNNEDEAYLQRVGNVINCLHHLNPEGCGFSNYCDKCIVRNTALSSLEGKSTNRAKGRLEFATGKSMNVLVTSAPFEYENTKFAVVVVEDISSVVELQGLIPICASCKRIRDDQGYWLRVEKYIEQHSEAEFTHDICPECASTLYSK